MRVFGKYAVKAGKRAVDYIRDDLRKKYGLASAAWAVVAGPGVGKIGEAHAGPLSIVPLSENRVRLECEPFAPESGLWNGPNVIPDNLGDGSLEASLWHDLVWGFADDIAEQTGRTRQEVMKWGNGILCSCWRGYGEKVYRKRRNRLARAAYGVCEFARRWWKAVFVAAAVAGIAGCHGCAAPPQWEMEDASAMEQTEGGGG